MGSPKRIIISGTGFPGTNDTWRMLQAALDDIFSAMARLAGSKTILYGIQPNPIQIINQPQTYTSGFVAYQSEILAFESGVPQASVTIVEENVSAEYDNGSTNGGVNTILPISQKRYMRFGTGGVVTFPFTDLVRLSTIKQLSQFTLPEGNVVDADYVHTDNNLTTEMINAWNAIVSNVKSNWNAAEGSSAEILNKPTNLLTFLRKGSSQLGNFPNGTDEIRTITFPSVGTVNYYVLGSLVSLGANYSDDNDVMWLIRNKTPTSFQLTGREVSSNNQNVKFDYVLIPI